MGLKNKIIRNCSMTFPLMSSTTSSTTGKQQLTKEEKAEILAKKAATKAAKNKRKVAIRELKAQDVPKTPFEKYAENPKAFEETLKNAQEKALSCWKRLKWEYHTCRDRSKDVSSSSTLSTITECMLYNDMLKTSLDNASSAQDLANTLGRDALTYRAQSEEAQGPAPESAEPQIFFQECARLVQTFLELDQARLATYQTKAIEIETQTVPVDFFDCLSRMFPQTNETNRMILCAFIKILVDGITFSGPTCEIAISVLYHYRVQDKKNHELDVSKVVLAKHCAEGEKKCLACAGVQALNVVRRYSGRMTDPAINKMLVSLLNGHETALNALSEYIEILCRDKFKPNRDSEEDYQQQQNRAQRYCDLIMMFNHQFCRRYDHPFSGIKLFSQEQLGEIVRLLLEHLGMTIEQVESHITAFKQP
jgi:hypothetical protein